MKRMLALAVFGLLAGAGSLLATEATGTIKKLDADKGTIVVSVKGKDYTLKIAEAVKVIGTSGKPLAGGIKSAELEATAAVTIDYERGGEMPVLKEIRFIKAHAPEPKAAGQAGAKDPGKPTVGLKPIIEMTAVDRYKGEDGGLYGGGRNEMPAPLLAAAKAATAKIVPRDEKGKPSLQGTIGLVSLAYSNATREYAHFKPIADADPQKSPSVKIVDCSQGGQSTEKWVDPKGRPWTVTDKRLADAKLSPEQVQVVWAKLANIQPHTELMDHGKKLQRDATAYLQNAHDRFPNLRIVYLSSRTYGGWTNTLLNPEPYAYESSFVIRWLIQEQMKGSPELNYDPAKGPVRAPLILWGPYLWGNGLTPRKSDGLVWKREDFVEDGTHVSESGKQKVTDLLLKHFKTDPLAKTWYLKR